MTTTISKYKGSRDFMQVKPLIYSELTEMESVPQCNAMFTCSPDHNRLA